MQIVNLKEMSGVFFYGGTCNLIWYYAKTLPNFKYCMVVVSFYCEMFKKQNPLFFLLIYNSVG